MSVADFEKVYPFANEDLSREKEDKTSAVNFLRFELTPEMITAAKEGGQMSAGVGHPEYTETVIIPSNISRSLVQDLD